MKIEHPLIIVHSGETEITISIYDSDRIEPERGIKQQPQALVCTFQWGMLSAINTGRVFIDCGTDGLMRLAAKYMKLDSSPSDAPDIDIHALIEGADDESFLGKLLGGLDLDLDLPPTGEEPEGGGFV